MRTPFTADVPDEYGQAQWIPDVPSIEDQSFAPDYVSQDELDPLGLLPSGRPDIPKLSTRNTGGRKK